MLSCNKEAAAGRKEAGKPYVVPGFQPKAAELKHRCHEAPLGQWSIFWAALCLDPNLELIYFLRSSISHCASCSVEFFCGGFCQRYSLVMAFCLWTVWLMLGSVNRRYLVNCWPCQRESMEWVNGNYYNFYFLFFIF